MKIAWLCLLFNALETNISVLIEKLSSGESICTTACNIDSLSEIQDIILKLFIRLLHLLDFHSIQETRVKK